MFGQFSANLVQFFIRKKWIFAAVIGLIFIVLINGIRKVEVDEDLYSVFPKGKEYQKFSEILKRNNLNKQVVFSLKSSEDVDQNFDNLDLLSQKIKTKFSKELTDIEVYRNVDESALVSYLQSASISMLTESDYHLMEQKVVRSQISNALQKVSERLNGASSIYTGNFWAKDPLGVLTGKVSQLAVNQDSSAYEVEDGILYANNRQRLVFFANLKLESKNTNELVAFDEKLEKFKEKLNSEFKNLDFDYFGTFQIAAANAAQVKLDTFWTLLISVSLILLLLVWYYRSVLIPLYFLLPAGFGILSGVGMVGYLNPQISAISLATAGILLGIVLDYSFHFFTHLKHSGNLMSTVKEISSPMLIGSFTTIMAFAALLFTDSVVLQNFGLIALFTLMGSAIFTVIFLPVILHFTGFKLIVSPNENVEKAPKKLFVRLGLITVVVITILFLFQGTSMQFDADLNNLSYHPKELQEKEDAFTGINPAHQKKIYVFSSATSEEKAKEINFRLFEQLNPKKEQLKISELVSTAPYQIPVSKTKQSSWISFWQKHPYVEDEIRSNASKLGFSEIAFDPFFELIHDPNRTLNQGENLLKDLGLNKLHYSDSSQHSYLTSIVVDRSNLVACKQEINQVPGTYLLDLTAVAENMLNTVQKDFNFLLIFSSLLVFFSLLVVYGRIELALFAFFPMVLAWIWILGIAHLFDIQFNFVNIIIATFIFGLGDDFSIFMTDGLIQKYKTNTDSISSYKSAIILSAVTTIIGTGALYFAKHPAIHSIAMISVVGISTILLITIYLQPTIFDWFVNRRVAKKRGPITFFTFIYSIMLFTYFFLGSMFLTLFLVFILIPFPVSKKKKKYALNYLVTKLAKSTLYAGFHIKKEVLNKEQLDYSRPSIIIANHSSFLDILAVLMLHPRTIIMVKKWVYNSPVFGLFIRYSGYIFAEEGAEGNLEEIKKRFADGYSLVIFPEGTRSEDGEIKRFHKGAFLLSQALDVEIQPLLLIGIHEVNPKNDIMINRGTIIVKPLPRMKSLEGENYVHYSKRVLTSMREALDDARSQHAKSKFWLPQIMQNYVLKGPVLEWYVRVKYGMERKNFEFYDELIGQRKTIYDIGCGYGYLSYYLHYRNKKREIIGLDYDQEKIDTAQNAIRKNEHLQFQYADVCGYEFKPADAVFLNDVLHYFPFENQMNVLNNAVSKLNDNGILFVRDGVVELRDRLKNTQLTEKMSTKWFKFNKSEHELEFLSIEKMKAFAVENSLSFQMIEHSKTTSNVLFIFRKPGNGA